MSSRYWLKDFLGFGSNSKALIAFYIGFSFSFYGLSLYCLVIALSRIAAQSLLYGFIVFAVF
jgi:hypothetical protein